MAAAPASIRRARPLLGTFVEIAVARAPAPAMEAAVEAAFAAVAKVHRLMSFHDADSDVSRLNRAAAAGPVRVNAWTYRVLQIALDLHRRSAGAFDVTVATALQRLGLLPDSPSPFSRSVGWGSASTGVVPRKEPHPTLPEDGEGQDSIRLLPDNCVRFSGRDVRIDLGGIAKGFAVDRAIEALRRHGMTEGLVNAGGDLAALGRADHAVDIRDPRCADRMIGRVMLNDAALASSAGRIDPPPDAYVSASAVINPATGMPARDVLGATVRASRCVVADALTKVVMNAGEDARAILEHYGASALFIRANGEALATAGWSNIRHAA
jgi:thiamine biosynthesis lipoprotein